MPFKTILRDLVQSAQGATGAILTDWEGEAVEQFSLTGDDYELKIIGAHQNIILNRIREIRQSVPSQGIREAVITTDRLHVIIGSVGNDYALVVTMARDALVPRAMVRVRQCIEMLEKEIY